MFTVLLLALVQSVLMVGAQVFLKLALTHILPFAWSQAFWRSLLLSPQLALSGVCFAGGSYVWLMILKRYPLSVAYPMLSISYVLGMFAAVYVFGEEVTVVKWVGVLFIVFGCMMIAR